MSYKHTALVVEDDAHHLFAITSLLKTMHIHYKRNTTGADVLQQVHRLRPDFVLLDLNLPNGDPFVICNAIRSDPSIHHIPIIATAEPNELLEFTPRIHKASFSACLPKPVCQREFETLLTNILETERV